MKNPFTIASILMLALSLSLLSCNSGDSSNKKVSSGLNTYSGTETGNGGGVVVCRDSLSNEVKSVELLDLYEAKALYGRKLGLGDGSLDFKVKIQNVLKKLDALSPTRSKKYRRIYERFFQEAKFVPNSTLVYIDDAANIVLPIGCQKEQASILRVPQFPGDARYVVSEFLWNKLDNDSKAALVLHEIIYQEGLEFGHENSSPTRYLVGLLSSQDLEPLTPQLMSKVLIDIGFKRLDFGGTMVKARPADSSGNTYSYYEEDDSKFFEEVRPNEIVFNGLTIAKGFFLILYNDINQIAYVSRLKQYASEHLNILPNDSTDDLGASFAKDGKIKEITAGNSAMTVRTKDYSFVISEDYSFGTRKVFFDEFGLPFNFGGVIEVKNEAMGYYSGKLFAGHFDQQIRTISKNGVILRARTSVNQLLKTPQGPLWFVFQDQGYIYFDENGIVKSGKLRADQLITTQFGPETILNPEEVEFDQTGAAILMGIEYQPPSDPDNIARGCKFTNYKTLITNHFKNKLKFGNFLAKNKIDWIEDTFNVQQVEDKIITGSSLGRRYRHPTFRITFKSTSGYLFAINSIFSENGLILEPQTWWRTKRNVEGTPILKTCEQDFYKNYSTYYPIIKNETLNYEVKIGVSWYLGSLIEEFEVK